MHERSDRIEFAIRQTTGDDLDGMVSVINEVYPARATTVEQVREADRIRPAECRSNRWVALVEGEVVGYACYVQWTEYEKPTFHTAVVVSEAHRRSGIGAALWGRLLVDLERHRPAVLRADAFENLPEGLVFAQSRGFVDVFREGPSHLDVALFDPGPFAGMRERLNDQGIVIRSLAGLLAEDAGWVDCLFAAYCEAWADVPKEEEIPVPYAHWLRYTIEEPEVCPEAYMVAVHGDEVVGFTEIGKAPSGRPLDAGLAGVRRAYRRRGVSLALHLDVIAYARAHGHPRIRTSSATENIAMQSVYRRLGFVREPVWIQLERRLPAAGSL